MAVTQVLFFGDSITLADNDGERRGWPGRLVRGTTVAGEPLTAYNLGINGDTVRDIAGRWRAETAVREARNPGASALVFAYGFNDASQADGGGPQVPLAEALALSRDMIATARSHAPTLWVGPTPLDETVNPLVSGGVTWAMRNADIGGYSAAYRELAAELGVPYLELFEEFVASPRYLAALRAGDKVHPADDGYAMIAERIAAWGAWTALFSG